MKDEPELAGVYTTGGGEMPGLERVLTLQKLSLWEASWLLFLKADRMY